MNQKMTSHHQASWQGLGWARRLLTAVLALVLLMSLLTACSGEGEAEITEIAGYGDQGARFARKLAASCPQRYPYSSQESRAAELIVEELRSYGYEPELQTFTVTDEEGRVQRSTNIVARLNGRGFKLTGASQENEQELPEERHDLVMILGAHYDTPAPERRGQSDEDQEEPEATTEPEETQDEGLVRPDGIHDNASGVAAVLTAARILRQEAPGYEIIFVFFGAGTDDFRGARHYLSTLSSDQRRQIDAMVNIGPVYAGDKVYAHAGQNSVRSGGYKDYAKRRKLYQVTDIFFEYQLNTRNRYAIYTNQASFFVTLDSGLEAVFREWTTKLSDHTPFDRVGIPVVFMESGDYRIKKVEDVKVESRNPFFQDTGGVISGTGFDRVSVLEELFRQMDEQAAGQTVPAFDTDEPSDGKETEAGRDEDESKRLVPRLEQRINNTAFVLVQLTRKGPLHYEFKD
ncbi:MAG: M28 family peptidase [Clostridiaceae bacterium]|nr:M28 family peptidase [Clostridiaceae bacterium]